MLKTPEAVIFKISVRERIWKFKAFFSVTPKSGTGFQRIKLVAKLREK